MVKRSIDILVSSLILIVTAPLTAIVSVAIPASMGRPILYRQERPGLDAEPLVLVRSRTMRNATDAGGRSLPDADLRRTSLDGIPRLWNTITGEMSLAVTRPLMVLYQVDPARDGLIMLPSGSEPACEASLIGPRPRMSRPV